MQIATQAKDPSREAGVFLLELLVVLLERGVTDIGAIKVEVRTRGSWTTLTLVARVVFGAAVRGFAWARQLEEAQLPNLHARLALGAHIIRGHSTQCHPIGIFLRSPFY